MHCTLELRRAREVVSAFASDGISIISLCCDVKREGDGGGGLKSTQM